LSSDWSVPDGSCLLTLDASSVASGPEGTSRIVWMINGMIKTRRDEPSSLWDQAIAAGIEHKILDLVLFPQHAREIT